LNNKKTIKQTKKVFPEMVLHKFIFNSSRFVIDGAAIISCQLTHIINLSLIQGVVPDDLKAARLVPLYKKSDKTEVGNYRRV
jgi:hypothetical protein